MKYRTWKCGICGESVIEGQRFIFVKDLGFVHLECAIERLLGKESVSRDIIALLDANEVITYSIVRFKDSEIKASSKETKDLLINMRRELEKISAQLSSKLLEFLK
ncbi:MAG: DUF2175 family protein [Sulfolobales archaeon]